MTIRTSFISAAALGASLFAAPLAFAGPQYVDATGYAVSGYDVVAYFDIEQSPVGQPQPEAVLGSQAFTTEYNGATWAFSSAENLAKFEADPEKYAPAYDGHCAYGVAQNGKVPANPHLWRIVDDRLYLNIVRPVVGLWEKDIPGHIVTSEKNWTGLESKAASEKPIPSFSSPGPTN